MNWLNLFIFGCLWLVVNANDEENAKKYLTDFGYYNKHSFSNNELSNALKSYQKSLGIPETGALDSQTKAYMQKPRCGVPDKHGYYLPADVKWLRNSLTYRFENYGRDMNKSDVVSTIRKAFDMWMAVANLKVEETSELTSDMTIKFVYGDHPEDSPWSYPFNGKGGVLAHAFYPRVGRIHFDEDEDWSIGGKKDTTDFLWVAVHELGHALGLAHSNVRGTIMWPYYTGYNPNMKLADDDTRGMQYLFGKGPYVQWTTTTTTTTTTPTPPCIDKDSNCPSWSKRYCSSQSVIEDCRLSCNIDNCAPPTTTPLPTTTPVTTIPPCVDKNGNCPQWATIYCSRDQIRKLCRLSCNIDGCAPPTTTVVTTSPPCIDRDTRCPSWKVYCHSSKQVQTNCRFSCNIDGCAPSTTTVATTSPPCIDTDRNCPSWKMYCRSNRSVQKKCRLSCNIDGCVSQMPTTPIPCVDRMKGCVNWQSSCSNNSGVRRNCRKTCNVGGCNSS